MPDTSKCRISVVGCGHVGLVTAAGFAELGHYVTGIDIDQSRVAAVQAGRAPFREPRLDELLKANIASGRLQFTTSFERGLKYADAIFLCVSTPSTATGAADLSHVRAAVTTIAAVLAGQRRQPVIANKSTSPIGTGETIDTLLRRAFQTSRSAAPAIVSNPEFLREGHGMRDFLQPSRIVVGSDDPAAARFVANLYRGVRAPVLITNLRSAEMIKYVSNAYLATRVSFANEVSRLCEAIGVDADEVLLGAGMDPRIGSQFFSPGAGYGGSCLPKDVAALAHTGDSHGTPMRLLSAVQEVNNHQRKHVVNSLRRMLGGLEGRTVAVWGLAFKGGTDDLRESPAIDVIALLRNEGATVRCFDPAFTNEAQVEGIALCGSAEEACQDADALAIVTDWPQFRQTDLARLRSRMSGRVIFDGRNMLERQAAEDAGFIYAGIGRPERQHLTAAAKVPA